VQSAKRCRRLQRLSSGIKNNKFAIPVLPQRDVCAKGHAECLKIPTTKEHKMRFGKLSLAALAAASLVVAPVAAQTAKTSKAVAAAKAKRAAAEAKLGGEGGSSGVIIAIVAALAVVGGIVIAAGNDGDGPTSP
jgi:hypothetical protein